MSTLDILQDPEQAVSNINSHDHTGGLGGQVPEAGLKDGAVGTAKLQDGAVTGAKIAPAAISGPNIANGTISSEKLSADTITTLGGGAGLVGISDYIGSGMKLAASLSDLSVNVLPGKASIKEKKHEIKTAVPVSLNPNKTALLYAQYNGTSEQPGIGKYEAQYPALEDDHVIRYIFNNKVNDTTILDTTSNHNDLTCHGGCTLVDGWADKAIKVDGTTGYMTSANTDGFPTGASPRSVTWIMTINSNTVVGQSLYFFGYGTAATNQSFAPFMDYTSLKLGVEHHTNNNMYANFALQIGGTYMFTYTYDGINLKLYANGFLLLTQAATLATVQSTYKLIIGRLHYTSGYWTPGTYHYFDMRNTCLPPQKVAQLANKALFPCQYKVTQSQYPAINRTEYHEYRFDEISGTNVADSGVTATPWNGTAGAVNTIIASDTVGNARLCPTSEAGIIINTANQLTPNYSFAAIVKFNDTTEYRTIIDTRVSGNGFCLYIEPIAGAARLVLYDNADSIAYSVGKLYPNKANFIAFTYDNGYVRFYINSGQPDSVFKITPTTGLTGVTSKIALGSSGNGTQWLNGSIDYGFILQNGTLIQEEIEQIYNSLMGQGIRSLADDTIPTDAISLGFVQTGSSRVVTVDDSSYKYGRNETPFKNDRNKRVFLGWYWVTKGQKLLIPNPLGTRNIKCSYLGLKTMSEELWQNINADMMYNTGYGTYGIQTRGANPLYFQVYVGDYVAWWGNNSYDDTVNWDSFWLGIIIELN